jgi:hypothetical protein
MYPQFAVVPLFALVIVPALVVAIGPLLEQLNGSMLSKSPITILVLGLLPAGVLSSLSIGNVQGALDFSYAFGICVLFYLLLVGVVDTPSRLRSLLFWLVVWSLVAITPAVLDFKGIIHVPGMRHPASLEGESLEYFGEDALPRLSGTGLFGDPNDICLNLSTAMILCLFWLGDRRLGLWRFLWLLPLGFFGYAFTLTRSRGGFLMLLVGLLVLFRARFRKKKAFLLALVALPLLFTVIGGRQSNITVSSGTGQQRVQMWQEGLFQLRRVPLLGIGPGQYTQYASHVAHNSYVHAFVEMGLVGGTLFFGAFYYAFSTLYRLGSEQVRVIDPELRRMRPYVTAIVASYATGMLSLSENYIAPTYTMLGLSTALIRLTATQPPLGGTQLDGKLVQRIILLSVAFLVGTFIFIQINLRY